MGIDRLTDLGRVGQAAAQNYADSGTSSPSANSTMSGAIPQSERLLTSRPRSASAAQKIGGDRGERAYIKILTTDPAASLSRTGTGGADSTTTSIGGSSGGALYDAVTDTSSVKYGGYASFLLTDVSCSLNEKLQVVETFGDAEVVYYFGRQPIMFSFSGILIDSIDNNWFVQWLEMYGTALRGTQLARNYELVKIVLPNMEVIGTLTATTWQQNSANDVEIPFSFSFLAKQILPKPVVAANSSLRNEVSLINYDKAKKFVTQAQINSSKSAVLKLNKVVQDPSSTTADIGSAMTDFKNIPTIFGASGALPNIGTTSNGTSSGLDIFKGVTANLSGVRASLFSPVYGVLGSLAKLIKKVTGSINSIIGSFTNPIRNILRDIRNISNQAAGIVNLVNNSIDSVTGQIQAFDNDIQYTLATLKNTAGIISTAPETVSQSLRRLVNAGSLPLTLGFLQNRPSTFLNASGNHSVNKLALLNSGPGHTVQRGAFL